MTNRNNRNYVDEIYINDLKNILENGLDQTGRNGDTRSVFGLRNVYTLSPGSEQTASYVVKDSDGLQSWLPNYGTLETAYPNFPILTTKKVNFDQVKGELIGFLRGYTNNKDFEKLGCTVWRENSTSEYWLPRVKELGLEEGSLGKIYSHSWRNWNGCFDQIADVINRIKTNPTDRRLIVSAWNPTDLDEQSLPACHLIMQFYCDVKNKRLSLQMYQRSCDWAIGVPFNISSYALLLVLVANVTGYDPYQFIHVTGDSHIYHNHFDGVLKQLNREGFSNLPTLRIKRNIENVWDFNPEDLTLQNYQHDSYIKMKMSV